MAGLRPTLALLASIGLSAAIAPPPTFTMNLDAPAAQRWHGAVGAVLARHSWESSFETAFTYHNASLFSRLSLAEFGVLAKALETHFPEQYAELGGISTEFAGFGHLVTVEYLAAWAYFHELAHTDRVPPTWYAQASKECTGIVIQTAAGETFHGGNMDQSPESVRNVTLQVDFVSASSGKSFRGVDWYWFTTGVTRAVKTGVATFQENWRTTEVQKFADTIALINQGITPHVYVFREILSTKEVASFTTAVNLARSIPLGAPFYVIGSGPYAGQGVIITRAPAAVDSELWLNASLGVPQHIVQTNYDQCAVVPPNGNTRECKPLPDSPTDPRRSAALQVMAGLGPVAAATELGVFATLGAYPVHNPHTAYTALMDAAAGSLKTFVRTAMCPEHPGTTVIDGRYCVPVPAPAIEACVH